jgi:tetratricopeptide (TPR) repeat protein
MANRPDAARSTGAPSLGLLWQVPVFLLGMTALLWLWFVHPWAGEDPDRQITRDLEAARHVLAQPDGDWEAAVALARRAVEASRQFPARTGEAHLVLGLSHLRLAEKSLADAEAGRGREPPEPEGGEESDAEREREALEEHLASAREHLEEAERQGVPERQEGTLRYALARTTFYQGKDPERAAEMLEETADLAEDRAESYGLLTRAYLAIDPPDVKRALEANRKQRQVREAGEEILAPARLLGGELLLRLGQPGEARKTLELVGEQAAPQVRAKACLLRARSYQEEGLWRDAAELYEQTLAESSKTPLPSPAEAYYDLGQCYRRLGEKDSARTRWEECLRISKGGPEVVPAALDLALLYQEGKDHDKALSVLEKALGKVQKPADWDNPLADLARAREVFEAVAKGFREAGRYEEEVRLAQLYERIAKPGRAALLHGEAAAAWARTVREQARKAPDKQARQKAEARASELSCQAGQAFEEAAAVLTGQAQTDALWQGVQSSFACGNADRTVSALDRFLQRSKKPARLGEGYFLLGETYRKSGRTGDAELAYRECVKYPTRFQYLARYQLALNSMARGELDDAESALESNLRLMRLDPDPEAQEKSLFALGNLYYRRRHYSMVVRRLEEALGRFPNNPAAARARYQLADSYRRLASQQNQNAILGDRASPDWKRFFQSEHDTWLRKAARAFTDLDERLRTDPEMRAVLTEAERAEIPFAAAGCLFDSGNYKEALPLYERLAEEYDREHLDQPLRRVEALGKIISCYGAIASRSSDWQRWVSLTQGRLLEIHKEIPRLQEKDRVAWQGYVNEVSTEIRNELRKFDATPE